MEGMVVSQKSAGPRGMGRMRWVGGLLLAAAFAAAGFAVGLRAQPAEVVEPDRPHVVSTRPIGAAHMDDGRPVTMWLSELSDGSCMVTMFVDRGGGEQWGIGAFLPPGACCSDHPDPAVSPPALPPAAAWAG